MITLENQRTLLLKIAEKIAKKMVVYAIGGTAMMLHGLKRETLDINLVFNDEKERQIFKEIALSLGYEESDVRVVYGNKPRVPILIKLDDAHIDLFTRNVLGVQFSEQMIERAEQTHQFYDNLIIKPANIHDIIIMKSATGRIKDEDDILALLKNKELNWQILIDEAKNQVALGNERAVLELGQLLERLSNKGRTFVPKEVLDALWNLMKEQIDNEVEKNIEGKIKKKK